MLHIIEGDIGSGKTTRVLNEIQNLISQKQKCFLLVPEQGSLYYERFCSESLSKDAPLYFEVTSFTHLSMIFEKESGSIQGDTLDACAEHIMMWKVLHSISSQLKSKKLFQSPSAIAKTLASMKEFRAQQLTVEQYNNLLKNISQTELKDKLDDLKLLSEIYKAFVEEQYHEHAEPLSYLKYYLMEEKPLQNIPIFLDGFNGFSFEELEIIDILLKQTDVTITLAVPKEPESQLSAKEVLETKKQLLALSPTSFTDEELTEQYRILDPTMQHITKYLFHSNYKIHQTKQRPDNTYLSWVETEDPYDGADYVANDLLKHLKEEHLRYRDFIIITPNTTQYTGIIDASLKKCNIPFFLAHRSQISSLDPIKTIFCAYDVLKYNWRPEDVLSYLKCMFPHVDSKAVDYFELYCNTWNIRGKAWYTKEDWTKSTYGYIKEMTEQQKAHDQELLQYMNQVRHQFVKPLQELKDQTKKACTINKHIRALTAFLDALDYPTQLDIYAKEYGDDGNTELQQSYSALWNVLCNTFDTMSLLLPNINLEASEFEDLLHLAFQSITIGHLPSSIDNVTIGEASLLREGSTPYVYVLGVNEGEFPSHISELSAFSPYEKAILTSHGYTSFENMDIAISRDYFNFYRAITLASKHTTLVSYACDAALGETQKSAYYVRLDSLFETHYPYVKLTSRDLLQQLRSPALAFERLGRYYHTKEGEALRNLLLKLPEYKELVQNLDFDLTNGDVVLSKETCQMLYPDDLRLSQAIISDYEKCPLQYLCNHVLKLKSYDQASFDARNIGDFIHKMLEWTLKRAKEETGTSIAALSEEHYKELFNKAFEDVTHITFEKEDVQKNRYKHILKLLRQQTKNILDSIREEFQHSDFIPQFFELQIDRQNPELPQAVSIPLSDGTTAYVHGFIDRVDTYVENDTCYVRITDYKTGIKKYSDKSAEENHDYQLQLYLMSIWETESRAFKEELGLTEDGTIHPAGFVYFSSLSKKEMQKEGIHSEEQAKKALVAKFERSGKYTSDPEILHHLDSSEKHSFSIGSSKKPPVFDEPTLQTQLQEIMDSIRATAEGIKTGQHQARPDFYKKKNGTCRYCPYISICRTIDDSDSTNL